MCGRFGFVFFAISGSFLVMALFCTSAEGLTGTFCEWGNVNLFCTPGMTLKINSATYGRVNPYMCCGFWSPRRGNWPSWPVYTAPCSTAVTDALKPKCDGLVTCTVPVTNTELGQDPCPNVIKYVVVDYDCVTSATTIPTTILPTTTRSTTSNPASVLKAEPCEHESLQIACPIGQRLDIITAVYGRSDATTCPVIPLYYPTSCTVDAMAAVAARCNGQQSCFVRVLDLVAGVTDPCFGTYKYLTVGYRCIT